MDIATDSNKNGKRVCFTPMKNSSPSNPISTAIAVAKTSITITLMSLPPAISSLAKPLCTEFTKLHQELYSCSQSKEHITEDSDHIPHSGLVLTTCELAKIQKSSHLLIQFAEVAV